MYFYGTIVVCAAVVWLGALLYSCGAGGGIGHLTVAGEEEGFEDNSFIQTGDLVAFESSNNSFVAFDGCVVVPQLGICTAPRCPRLGVGGMDVDGFGCLALAM